MCTQLEKDWRKECKKGIYGFLFIIATVLILGAITYGAHLVFSN